MFCRLLARLLARVRKRWIIYTLCAGIIKDGWVLLSCCLPSWKESNTRSHTLREYVVVLPGKEGASRLEHSLRCLENPGEPRQYLSQVGESGFISFAFVVESSIEVRELHAAWCLLRLDACLLLLLLLLLLLEMRSGRG